MMKTHYRTFILRLRLDDLSSVESAEVHISGSVHQAGLQDVYYFDSVQKFLDTMHSLVDGLTLSEVIDGNSD
jgi:hypothetical protein